MGGRPRLLTSAEGFLKTPTRSESTRPATQLLRKAGCPHILMLNVISNEMLHGAAFVEYFRRNSDTGRHGWAAYMASRELGSGSPMIAWRGQISRSVSYQCNTIRSDESYSAACKAGDLESANCRIKVIPFPRKGARRALNFQSFPSERTFLTSIRGCAPHRPSLLLRSGA